MTQARAKTVPCPTCGRSAIFGAGNPYRPFCSERCKLIDLGNWADECYRVAGGSPVEQPDAARTEGSDRG